MWSNTLLMYIVAVSVLMYVLIMGPSRYHRDGLVGKAHVLLARVPRIVTVILATVLLCSPQRGRSAADKLEHYLFDKKHPLMQMAYVSMTGGAIVIYYTWVFHLFLMSGVSPFHMITAPLVTLFSLYCYIKACYSDPGIITKDTVSVDAQVFSYDGSLYMEDNVCKTCEFKKPARSKHCRLCDHCVRKFDHHCGWLNNDVGEDNLYWFYLFMLSHIVLCIYGTWTCAHLLSHLANITGVWKGSFVNAAGEQYAANWYTVSQYMIQKYTTICSELLFMGCVTVMMTVFFFYNLYYTARNLTTNETFKISDLRDHNAWYDTQIQKYNHYVEIHGAEKLADIKPPEKPPPIPDLSKGWLYDKGYYCNISTIWSTEHSQVVEKKKRALSKKSMLSKKKKRQ